MFCSNCGSKIADDAIFCSVCGTRIAKLEEPKPFVNEPEEEVIVEPKKSSVSFDWSAVKDEPHKRVNADVHSPWGTTEFSKKDLFNSEDFEPSDDNSRTMSFIDLLKKERDEREQAAADEARQYTEKEETPYDYSAFDDAPSYYVPPLYDIKEEVEIPTIEKEEDILEDTDDSFGSFDTIDMPVIQDSMEDTVIFSPEELEQELGQIDQELEQEPEQEPEQEDEEIPEFVDLTKPFESEIAKHEDLFAEPEPAEDSAPEFVLSYEPESAYRPTATLEYDPEELDLYLEPEEVELETETLELEEEPEEIELKTEVIDYDEEDEEETDELPIVELPVITDEEEAEKTEIFTESNSEPEESASEMDELKQRLTDLMGYQPDPEDLASAEEELLIEEIVDEEDEEDDEDESENDTISVDDIEKELFGEMTDDEVEAEATKKIDKFYTLYRKNEEFQKLLDEEYNKIKTDESVPHVDELLASEEAAQEIKSEEKAPEKPVVEEVVAAKEPETDNKESKKQDKKKKKEKSSSDSGGNKLTIVAVVLAALLVIVLAMILIMYCAPYSALAMKIDSIIQTISSCFSSVDVIKTQLLL